MTTSVPGQGGVKIEEIIDGLVLYMRSDALTKGLPAGKKWLKLDLKAAGRKQGVDIAQLQSLSGGGDPTQFLSYLAKAGDVQEGRHRGRQRHLHDALPRDDRLRQARRLGRQRPPTRCASSSRSAASRSCRPTSGSTPSQRVRRQTVAIAVKQPLPIKFIAARSTTSASASRSTSRPRRPTRRSTTPTSRAAAERRRAALGARGARC